MTINTSDTFQRVEIFAQEARMHRERERARILEELPQVPIVEATASALIDSAHMPMWQAQLNAFLSFICGAAGRRYFTDYPLKPGTAIYSILIAESGAGKSGLTNGIYQLARTAGHGLEKIVRTSKTSTHHATFQHMREHKRMIMITSEAQGMLEEQGGGLAQQNRRYITDLFGKDGLHDVMPSMTYVKKGNEDDDDQPIKAASMSLCLEGTPHIWDYVRGTMLDDGYIARFLFFIRKEKTKVMADHDVMSFSDALFMKGGTDALRHMEAFGLACSQVGNDAVPADPVTVRIDPAAQAILSLMKFKCADMAQDSEEGSKLWSRAAQIATKLATGMAAFINPHFPTITEEIAQWACEFTQRRVHEVIDEISTGGTGGSREEKERIKTAARKIMSIVKSNDGFPVVMRKGYLTNLLIMLKAFKDLPAGYKTMFAKRAVDMLADFGAVDVEEIGQDEYGLLKEAGFVIIGPAPSRKAVDTVIVDTTIKKAMNKLEHLARTGTLPDDA